MSDMGLYIALTGLFAQKKAMDVTGQNIANASTSGYSRQRADLETNEPWPVPSMHTAAGPGQFGAGVTVKTVSRIHDLFLDQQIRQQSLLQGEWQQRSDALSQVETILMEPSDTGLSSLMEEFWDAWDQLSKYPESSPVRTTVSETSATLADNLRNTYTQLQTLKQNLNDQIGIKIDHVNDLLTQIASLNSQIHSVSVSGFSPNDLMDRRDSLLEELSSTVSFQATIQEDNTVSIAIGNATVVNGAETIMLRKIPDGNGNYQVGITLGTKTLMFQWSDLGGELKGLAQVRDVDIAGYMAGLDQLAATLSTAINSLHIQGYGLGGETGIPFFVGSNDAVASAADPRQVTSAGSIYVNPYITANTDRIAAATGVTQSTTTTQGSASSAVAQVETLTIGSGVTTARTLQVEVTAAGMSGSPKTISIDVSAGDSAETIAGKIRTALSGDSDIGGFFTVEGSDADVVLTANTPADNDDTMDLSVYGIIPSGSSPSPGDNGNALLLYQLRDQALTFTNASGAVVSTDTANNFYKSMVAGLGVASSQAQNMVTNQEALLEQLHNRSEEVSGVSLDEEMANMIQYQSAYQAAAKLINVISEMMDTLINLGKG